jgi:hypothetical protein
MNTGNSVREADERRVATAYALSDPALSDPAPSDTALAGPALAGPALAGTCHSDLEDSLPDLQTDPETADEASGTRGQTRGRFTRTPPSFRHVQDIQELIDKLDAVTQRLRHPRHS